jgi:Fe-S-cluster containining protein
MESCRSLDLIRPKDSGILSFNSAELRKQLELLADNNSDTEALLNSCTEFLTLFLQKKFSELEEKFQASPELMSSVEIKALRLINLLILKRKPDAKFFYGNTDNQHIKKLLSAKFSKALIQVYAELAHSLDDFPDLDLLELDTMLYGIGLAYTEFILKQRLSNKYSQAYEYLQTHFADEGLHTEALRLLALYHRISGDKIKAEEYLAKYVETHKPNTDKAPKLLSHANALTYSPSEVLANWDKVLEECDQIQEEILINSGLAKDTCSYFQCADCCKYTFPTMSFTEYLYLKHWMEDNNYPIDKIKDKSLSIQEEYQRNFGEKLHILDKKLPENRIRGIENPHNFRFTCPFLEDGGCSCYPARPLLCRGFGLATDNNISIKTCNYYMNQYIHYSSDSNEREVYDLRQAQTLAKDSDKFLTQDRYGQEQILSGTIVAWFSEEFNN